jgi:hypothetical protein
MSLMPLQGMASPSRNDAFPIATGIVIVLEQGDAVQAPRRQIWSFSARAHTGGGRRRYDH